MKPIRYTIAVQDVAAHLFQVSVAVDEPDPQGQVFALPAWIPGSYLIRDFARHIVSISAADARGRPLALDKLDKHSWRAAPTRGRLSLSYQVYAWDLSVRAAHLDERVGFFNGSSVFLAVQGREQERCEVEIKRPGARGLRDWRVATALGESASTARHGFGLYEAQNYDELIDQPVMLGIFELASFKAHRVPHEVVIAGPVPGLDMERLCRDLKRVCEAQIALFEPQTRRAPMSRYVFMTMALGEGYGGLEHRASTALIAARKDLPVLGDNAASEGYRTYLGLCSHEYFHTWNVKRIKPDVFAQYDLSRENYTPLLWLFEGFTSYYDDLMLARSGLLEDSAYLRLLGKTIGGVLRGPGRLHQSVAESSFDAWSKYYRQDENAPNAIVSYYTKGSLVALAFDLAIRARTRSRRSLDDVMRALWTSYGRDFYRGQARGIAPQEVHDLIREASGVELGELYTQAVEGTTDLPLTALFAPFGIELEARYGSAPVSLGARLRGGAECVLANVYHGGAAHHAGLSALDVLVAIDGLRVTGGNVETLLARYRPGDQVDVHAFRRDELRRYTLRFDAPEVTEYTLKINSTRVGAARLRERWLTGA